MQEMALFRQAAKLAAASGTATLAPQLATVIGGTCSALPSLCHLFSSSGNPAFFVRRSSSAAAAPLSEDDQRKAAVCGTSAAMLYVSAVQAAFSFGVALAAVLVLLHHCMHCSGHVLASAQRAAWKHSRGRAGLQ